jgi:aromatic ring hydroxylase
MTERAETAAQTADEPTSRPLTGDEYLESLDDGREVWIYGERVENVATHPALRNTARMVARLYDSSSRPTRAATGSPTRSTAPRTASRTCSTERTRSPSGLG